MNNYFQLNVVHRWRTELKRRRGRKGSSSVIQMWMRVQPHGYTQQLAYVSAETDAASSDCEDGCNF